MLYTRHVSSLLLAPGRQLELLDFFLEPQIDQGMRGDTPFFGRSADGLRQFFFDTIKGFLRFQAHSRSDRPGPVPEIRQVVRVPEITHGRVGSGFGDAAFSITSSFHNVFFLQWSYHEPLESRYAGQPYGQRTRSDTFLLWSALMQRKRFRPLGIPSRRTGTWLVLEELGGPPLGKRHVWH